MCNVPHPLFRPDQLDRKIAWSDEQLKLADQRLQSVEAEKAKLVEKLASVEAEVIDGPETRVCGVTPVTLASLVDLLAPDWVCAG